MGHKIYHNITASVPVAKAVVIELPNFNRMKKDEVIEYVASKNIDVNTEQNKNDIITDIKETLNVE